MAMAPQDAWRSEYNVRFLNSGPTQTHYDIRCMFVPSQTKTNNRCNDCNKFTGNVTACKHCGSYNLDIRMNTVEHTPPSYEDMCAALEKIGLFPVDVSMEVDRY